MQIGSALACSLRGNFRALWVPPVGAIVDVLVHVQPAGPLTFDNAIGLCFGLGVGALLGLLIGAAWLAVLGFPVLCGLILSRTSHPLIAAAIGGSLMYWLYYGRATQTAIGAATAMVAAVCARSNLALQRTASPTAEL